MGAELACRGMLWKLLVEKKIVGVGTSSNAESGISLALCSLLSLCEQLLLIAKHPPVLGAN